MQLAASILKEKGYDILLLETTHLHNFIYEDSDQVLIEAETIEFTTISKI